MAEFFGFKITRDKPKSDPKQNFSTPQAEDGTQVVAAGGYLRLTLTWKETQRLKRI